MEYMQEKWNQFVYYLCEDKNNGVEEPKYHLTIEAQLQLLGWMKYKNEICHKPNLSIGNNGHIQPDILIQKDDMKQFVIEVKRPLHEQNKKDRDQLVSYMRQLKLKAGIYIGERIELFYDQPDSENAVSVLTIPLELNNKRGVRFVELFSKDRFSKENIIQFCEDRIKEMHHQESLNKIKDHIIHDAQDQITESMKMYLMEKYGNTFSESDIVSMLETLSFTAVPKDRQVPFKETTALPQKQTQKEAKAKHQHDKTQYSINGGSFEGKRRFVHQLVKLYVEQHPSATFVELENLFPPELQGSYGVIRTLDYISKKGHEERYLMKSDELLRSADDVVFAVCSQWGIGNTPKVIELAKKLGYKIATTGETNQANVPEKVNKKVSTIACILTRNAYAMGIFDILTHSLTVLKGSTINPWHLDKIHPTTKLKREALIAEYTERRGDELIVVKDVTFNTPSGAGIFCVGGSSNGWKDWRDVNNNELNIYRK